MSFPHKTTTELPANLKFENTSFAAQAKMNTYNKPAIFVQNNNNPTVQKSKPRGGWDDGEDEPTLNVGTRTQGLNQQNSFNQSKSSPVSTGTSSNANDSTPTIDEFVASKKSEIKECDEAFFNKNEYEAKIVMELIQPGGARIKPSDAVLNEFCRACETLQTQVIGSLLFHNLEASIAWQSKAKNLYAIEALAKKVKKYNEYFKANVIVLKAKQFPHDGPNAAQLKKILSDVANVIDGVSTKPQPQTPQNNGIATQPKFIQEIDPLDQTQGWQNPIKEEVAASPVKTNLKVTTTPSWGNTAPNNNIQQQQQPVVKPEVKSAQPTQAKFNPFGITPSTNNVQSATSKPSAGGLPGAFKNRALNANPSPSATKSTSSLSSQDDSKNRQPSITSSTLPQPSSTSLADTNSLITSLSGLDFGGQEQNAATPTNKLNDLYSLYPQQQPVYNMPNLGPMPYPQQFSDPHMMGPGPFPQPFYPPPQFNGGMYNGSPQFQGQYPPPQQFNGYPPSYPMQGFQGHPGHQGPGPMMYGGPEGFSPQNQYQNQQQYQNQNQNQSQQQTEQNGEEDELSQPTQAEIKTREEQERKKQEEMQKMKKQQEIESKFDSLKFLV